MAARCLVVSFSLIALSTALAFPAAASPIQYETASTRDLYSSNLSLADSNFGVSALSLATASIIPIQAPPPPIANTGGPYVAFLGNAITFFGDGSSSPNGDPLGYTWTYGPANNIMSHLADPVISTALYGTTGIFQITLVVKDLTTNNVSTATTTLNLVAPVPEPCSLAALATALLGLGMVRRCRA